MTSCWYRNVLERCCPRSLLCLLFWSSVFSVSSLWHVCILPFLLFLVTNYQHVVTEYGVHWNFFFTLAGVAVFSAIFSIFMRSPFSIFIFILALVSGYQYWLCNGGTEYATSFVSHALGIFWMMSVQLCLTRTKRVLWAASVCPCLHSFSWMNRLFCYLFGRYPAWKDLPWWKNKTSMEEIYVLLILFLTIF